MKVLIFFSLYLNIGYFFRIGSFDVTYSEVLLLFCIIVGTFFIGNKIPKKSLSLIGFFLLFIFLGYTRLALDPSPPLVLPTGEGWDSLFYGRVSLEAAGFTVTHVLRIIRISMFFIFYYIFDRYVLSDKERTEQIKIFVVNSAIFVAFIGIVEQLIKIFISSTLTFDFLNKIFGITSSQLTWYVERGGFPILQGLMLEPGHYAQSFIPAIFIVFLSKTYSQKNKLQLLVLFSYVIFFSGSFAGIAIISLMILMYAFGDRRNKHLKIALVFTVFLLGLFTVYKTNSSLYNYYSSRAIALLTNSNIGSSESVRSLSLDYGWQLIKDYPLLGVGFGTTSVTGFIPSMVINFGLLGSVTWFSIMRFGFSPSRLINVKWGLLLMLSFIFMGGVGDVYGLDILLMFSLVFRDNSHFQKLNDPKIKVNQ